MKITNVLSQLPNSQHIARIGVFCVKALVMLRPVQSAPLPRGPATLVTGSSSLAQHWSQSDSAHILMEMLQLHLSWCESIHQLQRYSLHKIVSIPGLSLHLPTGSPSRAQPWKDFASAPPPPPTYTHMEMLQVGVCGGGGGPCHKHSSVGQVMGCLTADDVAAHVWIMEILLKQ